MIEKEFVTKHEHDAIVMIITDNGRLSHRCGYVRIEKDHPLYGLGVFKEIDLTMLFDIDQFVSTYEPGLDAPYDNPHYISELFYDVHGGVTYSGKIGVTNWWIGFDCAHGGDGEIEEPKRIHGHVWTLDEVVDECEKLSEQLALIKKLERRKNESEKSN